MGMFSRIIRIILRVFSKQYHREPSDEDDVHHIVSLPFYRHSTKSLLCSEAKAVSITETRVQKRLSSARAAVERLDRAQLVHCGH